MLACGLHIRLGGRLTVECSFQCGYRRTNGLRIIKNRSSFVGAIAPRLENRDSYIFLREIYQAIVEMSYTMVKRSLTHNSPLNRCCIGSPNTLDIDTTTQYRFRVSFQPSRNSVRSPYGLSKKSR